MNKATPMLRDSTTSTAEPCHRVYRDYLGIIGRILGLYGDNGKENGNYYSILGRMTLNSPALIWCQVWKWPFALAPAGAVAPKSSLAADMAEIATEHDTFMNDHATFRQRCSIPSCNRRPCAATTTQKGF